MSATVCIVDDDAFVRRSLANLLRSAGFDTLLFGSGAQLLASPQARGAGCALLDLRMPGLTGLQVQGELARLGWQLPVICMSAHWDDAALEASQRNGAVACLGKPFNEDVLLKAVEAALALNVR
ncbi:response regulator [Pseudomonas sp. SWI6]|uniref:Response regulator n=1 Tax=Pseudomonas taiwanensis TaxID=470150 RepID=A0ABR6VCT3_9PSED|nr:MULTISPECIES: response regulator [Pseudomonas]AGZ33018.1 response regulator receiver protein [Pseudomonas sp. VLB120]AVD85381.1 response regulator [Pseudomonas sp. SWI6]AVD87612.1 response regulator [Pseudomonas sp. SWI44]MBC3478301.1 response regulator [Pseudomonas taiwanensis]MBC3492127.1 response regulator [Pseudomonas taiwanensis]